MASEHVNQVGGDHYQSEYQHWDWVVDVELPYLPACVTKYVTRWRKKNGIADLQKARSYLEKIGTTESQRLNSDLRWRVRHHTERFIEVNKIPEIEASICWSVLGPMDMYALRGVIGAVDKLIRVAERESLHDTETRAMEFHSRRIAGGVDHPAPFGYDGDG